MQTMTLLNQTKIPVLGFGTYKITDPTLAKESVILFKESIRFFISGVKKGLFFCLSFIKTS